MKRAVAAVLAIVFLASSIWSFTNGAAVEEWLMGQVNTESAEQTDLIQLQDDEQWLVVVVDFDQHTAGNGWGPTEAENLLNQAVVPYIEQVSGNASLLTVTVHERVVRASNSLEHYGQDATGKDTGADGAFLPAALAEEAVASVRNDVDWNMFDLNKDGYVDRLLVLHTTKGQEENPGIEGRIWSHFTHFEEPISLPGGLKVEHYTMASLQTGSSGVGTIVHEMLHQMGAVDLYPVHDEVGVQTWKGPGDWDIMASGNWNGGGRWPAMPTAANMELIRPERIETINLEWPETAARPCIGPSVELAGVTQGGQVLKIPISDRESIFVEHRSDSGFDSRLPGSGLLVSYQDLSVGDIGRNEVNTNPNLPWLKVVEADEGEDLVRGSNQGEASDVFLNNTSFGAEGVKIRTHDGVLVPWVATVSGDENLSVSFTAPNCTPGFTLDLNDHGTTVLPTESVPVSIVGATDTCTSELTSSDGRGVGLVLDEGTYRIEFSMQGTPNSVATVSGTVACGDSVEDIEHTVHILNRIPSATSYSAVVHPESITVLTVPLPSEGAGEQRLFVHLDGPLERVANVPTSVVLANGGVCTLTVEPNGLLSENMLIHGELILSTDEGQRWVIDVELEATAIPYSWWTPWIEPGRVIGLMLAVLGLSALTTAVSSSKTAADDTAPSENVRSPVVESIDAWGRPIDGMDSANSFDVQE
jgi:M6 family metalloprotease-like protein